MDQYVPVKDADAAIKAEDASLDGANATVMADVTLPEGFDAAAVRVTGNVVGKAPFTGTLSHRGWRVADTRLPKLAAGHDAAIVAQAEVEL